MGFTGAVGGVIVGFAASFAFSPEPNKELMPLTALAADPPALIGASVTPSGHVELTFDKPMAAPGNSRLPP